MIDAQPVPEIQGITPADFVSTRYPAQMPVVIRGLAKDWPAVQAARQSDQALADYLTNMGKGGAIELLRGPAAGDGLFFYSDDLDGLNFRRETATIEDAIALMMDAETSETAYVQAQPAAEIVPDFAAQNPSQILTPMIAPRIWIGSRLAVQTHFDLSQNIACVVGGRRRFTLFPPDQVGNLYMGPMELTPAGTPISLVRLEDVDYERFPKFRDAEAAALTAELAPGDAIFIPYLWWHHVQSLSGFNVLVNYWWTEYEALGSPMDTMLHAILSFRDLPTPMRQAWKAMFETYVFDDGIEASKHIPESRRGGLGLIDPSMRAGLWRSLHAGVTQTVRNMTGR